MKFVSYSMLKTYEECPLKYKFRYVDNLRIYQRDRPYLTVGNCLHAVLREFFKLRDISQRTYEKLNELFEQNWSSAGFSSKDEESEYKEQARNILSEFYRTTNIYTHPLYLERKFEIPFKDSYLVGVIDRIDKLDDGVEIIDYKTSKYIPKEEELKRDLQLTIYAIAVWEILRIPPKVISLYYLPNKKVSTTRTPQEIQETKEYIFSLIEQIKNDKNYHPKSSKLCDYCDFLVICPLSGFGLKPMEKKDITESYREMIKYLESVRQNLHNLYTVALELSSILDKKKLIEESGEKIKEIINVEKVCIICYEPEGFYVGFNTGYKINNEKLTFLEEEAKLIMDEKVPISTYPKQIYDISKTIYNEIFLADKTITNLLISPLSMKDKFFGFVFVANKKDLTEFTGFEKKYLQNFLTNISTFLYNIYLYEQATTDGLTKIYTREYTLMRIQQEISRAKRYNIDLSLLMLDIDHFKQINDTLGYMVGDRILKRLSEILKTQLRTTDILGRYGGEEFIILLPHTSLNDSYKIAERLRKKIEETDFQINRKVTISLGVSSWDGKKDLTEFINAADIALYQAKNSGRNKVCLYQP